MVEEGAGALAQGAWSERSDEDEKEEPAMNFERIYERWEKKTKAQGKLEAWPHTHPGPAPGSPSALSTLP